MIEHTKEGYPIWVAEYTPYEEAIEGELVQDLLPSSGSPHITNEQLKKLLLQTAEIAYAQAEKQRLYYAKTPDGLRDKTIHNYKPVPYRIALQQSSPILQIPGTGEETWQGDSINPIPSECSDILFLSYPKPLLLEERVKSD